MANKKKATTTENPAEMYARWYFEELIQHGFLKRIDREPELILVLPKKVYKREKHFKTKPNEQEEFTLMSEINYTYDFRLVWEEKAINIFTNVYEKNGSFKYGEPTFVSHYIVLNNATELVSFVDVKPHYSAAQFGGNLSTFYTFPFIQKFLMATRGLYINKMVPINAGKHGISNCMFNKTFTPNRYRFTDGGTTTRSNIRFKVTSLQTYATQRKGIIDSLKKEELTKTNQQTLL